MKKLMLKTLSIVGLIGSSVHGFGVAAAMGMGAKAWTFAQKVAVPLSIASAGYELGKAIKSQSNLEQQIAGASQQAQVLNNNVVNLGKLATPLFTSPQILKLAGIDTDQPTTWYGKFWKGVCYADGVTDTLMSKIQKVMLLSSVFGSVIGLGNNAYAHQQAAKVQPQSVPDESLVEEIIPEKPVVVAKKLHRRRGYRRSAMVARR